MTQSSPSAVIVGFGNAGRLIHLPLLRAAGFSVTTVLSSSSGAQERARQAGLHPVSSIEAAPAPDVVAVAVPDDAHEDAVAAALTVRPRVVVVEKPLATSTVSAVRMARMASAAGTALVPFQNRRWDGDYLTVKDVVRSGRLGPIHRVSSTLTRWAPSPGQTWREERRAGLDGKLADLGAHAVDQLVELFGPVTEVYAEISALRAEHGPNDDCFLALKHRSDVHSHTTLSAVSSALLPRFVVQGARGSLQIEGFDPQQDQLLQGMRPGSPGWGVEAGRVGRITGDHEGEVAMHPGDWTSFYHAVHDYVRRGGELPATHDEAIAVLRVLEAARRSSEEGAVIRVED